MIIVLRIIKKNTWKKHVYLCNEFLLSSWVISDRRNCINKSKLSIIELCCSQTRGNVLIMICALFAASTGVHIYNRKIMHYTQISWTYFSICMLTRIAESRYRLSRDDMAISFNALSDRIPSQLKKFRNNFNALLNWRWKNDDFASWSLNRNFFGKLDLK